MVILGVTDFWLYSDNCGGQNRNKYVLSMLVFASAKYNINVKLTFLQVGHTQNESDSVHSMIEKNCKGKQIFTLDQWCEIIETAKETGFKYEVIKVKYDMIFDFKSLGDNQNWNKNVQKTSKKTNVSKITSVPVGISQFKQILVEKDTPNQLKYKLAFEKDYETLVTRKEKNQVNVQKFVLKKAYTSVQGLTSAKIKDLLSLCDEKSNIIPQEYHSYYKSFPHRPTNSQNAEENETEAVAND